MPKWITVSTLNIRSISLNQMDKCKAKLNTIFSLNADICIITEVNRKPPRLDTRRANKIQV